MGQFWEHSWAVVDIGRVEKYIDSAGKSPDPIIRCLKAQGAETVCDAGCGCGAYSLRLAENGFKVFGFDVASKAVEIAVELLRSKGIAYGEFRVGDITATGYEDGQFDAVVSRDVIDHMGFCEGIAAVKELYRIVKADGHIIITLDKTDDEYETEPHTVTADGDYLYTAGKWKGMTFHPYSESEMTKLVQVGTIKSVKADDDGLLVVIVK